MPESWALRSTSGIGVESVGIWFMGLSEPGFYTRPALRTGWGEFARQLDEHSGNGAFRFVHENRDRGDCI
jgi:hypothetical protein